MCCRRPPIPLVAAVAFLSLFAADVPADLVTLKSGGQVRGKIVGDASKRGTEAETPVTVKTLTGAIVVIEREQIDSIQRRRLRVERYETLARTTPDDVDAQWDLAEWCRDNYLPRQREVHLRRVVKLDPQHERAHRALGHVNRDGTWVSRDEEMRAQGYVEYRGRYVSRQELEILQRAAAERKKELAWFKKIRLWSSRLNGRHQGRRQAAVQSLEKIDDPHAIPALVNFFQQHEVENVRKLYVKILSRLPGEEATLRLVEQSLNDPESKIRSTALEAITPEHYETARPVYVRELGNSHNEIVGRAAIGLAKVGDKDVVPRLIEALVTTHRYKVQVPDSSGYAFSSNGGFGQGAGGVELPPEITAGLLTGQYPNGIIVERPFTKQRMKTVTVKKDHKNREVLAALQKITGESFGYDQSKWRLWWEAQKVGAVYVPSTS